MGSSKKSTPANSLACKTCGHVVTADEITVGMSLTCPTCEEAAQKAREQEKAKAGAR